MDRRVNPPWRVTSSTWGPPLPCKQALKMKVRNCARQGVTTNLVLSKFFFYEFHKCINIVTVTMINCSKIQLSLFGSLRDSKSEKTVMWHLLIMVEKQEKKKQTQQNIE